MKKTFIVTYDKEHGAPGPYSIGFKETNLVSTIKAESFADARQIFRKKNKGVKNIRVEEKE